MNIRFMGAARTVTGSRHLLTVNNHQILLDCGLFQGKNEGGGDRNKHFGFDPHQIHCVILSHAHIDHSGMLPRMVREGFRGKVYATPATVDLCEIMLLDSARIQENDVRYVNKRRRSHGQKLVEPLYDEDDVRELMRLMVKIPYNTDWTVSRGVNFRFTDAGHILGSAAVNLTLTENERTVKLGFTGDVGRFHDLILREPQPFPQADVLLCESTYGNRLHDSTEDSAVQLLDVVRKTCVEKKGRLLIPSFSLGRTQEIVYTLDRMKNANLLPPIPVYVDSPLSVNATEIMRKHPENFNEDILKYMETDPDPFGFNGLEYVQEKEASQALNNEERPCIIISASGMLEAGRIKHHVKHSIGDARNTILIVGYCSPGTLGAALLGGAKEVHIFGEPHQVKAEVVRIGSYSAHADRNELLAFIKCQDPKQVKNVYLVHGETEAQTEFAEYLHKEGFANVYAPEFGEKIEL